MNTYGIGEKLTEANIPFTEETFLSNFWGTRFIFETRKIAIQAEKLLKIDCKRHNKKWAISVF